jgi:hypothetical protein
MARHHYCVRVRLPVGPKGKTVGDSAVVVLHRFVSLSRVPCEGEFLDFGSGGSDSERAVSEVHHVADSGEYNRDTRPAVAEVWLSGYQAVSEADLVEAMLFFESHGWERS